MIESYVVLSAVGDVAAWLYLWPCSARMTDRENCGHAVVESEWEDRQRLLALFPGDVL